MGYLLHIVVSPSDDETSKSRAAGKKLISAYKAIHGEESVVVRDLNANPIPHLSSDAIKARFMPNGSRPESLENLIQFQLDLVKELSEAKAVVISTPMWNWSIPSVLKAWIDHIVLPGSLFPNRNTMLTGKSVTIIVASGFSYTEGEAGARPETDYETTYLKYVFGTFGATDISIIRSEFGAAGFFPGVALEDKARSIAEAHAAAELRATQI